MQRGTIPQFCRCLLETGTLPSRTYLAVSFIRASVCEAICHELQRGRLVATIKTIGFSHFSSHDLFKSRSSEAQSEGDSMKACVRRLPGCAVFGSSAAARQFQVQAINYPKPQYPTSVAAALNVHQGNNKNSTKTAML